MSQEGLLIVITPAKLAEACDGWLSSAGPDRRASRQSAGGST